MQPDILEELYKKYYHTAYIYTLSLCKNRELTEDIVSEGFEKAFFTLEDNNLNFKYWLLIVCKNIWIDILRKEKKKSFISFDELEIASIEDTTEIKVVTKERDKIIFDAIISLSLKYRQVLMLYYYGNSSIEDISKIMGLSKTNIKTLLYRARVKLKKILEEACYEF